MQAAFFHDEGASAGPGAACTHLSVSIHANSAEARIRLADDAQGVGLRVARSASLDALAEEDGVPLGDIALVECPTVEGRTLAALCRLDERAVRTGAQLIVSTSMAALDDVFGCLDRSSPELLVDPGRADHVVALGRCLARTAGATLRDLSEEDRLTLLRVMEQVGRIAEKLDRLSTSRPLSAYSEESAFRFESPSPEFRGAQQDDDSGDRLVKATRPSLPDPRLIRRILRQRQLRGRFFDAELFADPAWDMLLDLAAARVEYTRVSVTSLCIASGVPPTTALRWISQLTEAGLVQRVEDETDRRRAFIVMTDKAADAMARFFAELGRTAGRMV